MENNHTFPSYTPTPIWLLDESRESDSGLVYNPTPINELDQYAPTNFSVAYAPAPSTLFTSEAPTYSPVVPTRTYESVSSKIFGCSPSKFALKNEPLDPECPSMHSYKAKKSPTVEVLTAAATEKRKKILSLYSDLYDKPEEPLPSSVHRLSLPRSSPSLHVKSTLEPSRNLPQSRPKQPLRPSSKIPMPIRKRYLDQFIEACIRICASAPEAYAMALREEQACHDKAQNRHVYLHSVINCLKIFNSQPAYETKLAPLPTKNSAKPMIVTKADSSSKDLDEIVKGPVFYKELKPFLLTEEELIHNKFPRPDKSEGAPRGKAVISVPDEKKSAVELYATNKRFCCRCGKAYEVDKFGMPTVKTECVYHWGKPVRRRMPGSGFDLHYTCCQAESGQEGCQVAPKGHVTDTNRWCDLEGYLTTLPPALDNSTDEPRVNVYSLDCEMVYTTGGCELARVTVIDTNLNVVVDRVIRPLNPIIDANTRFSGLSIEQLETSQLQITDVQMELLQLWDEDTILIGHSLESDLTALKFIHSKVVDTSIAFPHRRGLPYKRALRTIVSEYLEQLIQNDEAGHDSKEDAVACMRLMQKKVKECLQKRVRRPSH
ncbi:rna exonuclease 1 [Echinococcus multilocularis]|uniref:Rna exonuclease 1 n=1 Tax=Echinococcus multilocularis TaxID=6211 RepID=A0A087VX13_ECHMU|nr:rna exonuclease 1 [Echinococcus multilocularis]